MSQNELSNNLTHWDYIDRYSAWMYHVYQNYVGKKVFEVGAGMGRMVEYYIDNAERVVATGILPYWMKGKRKLGENESFSSSLNEHNSKLYNLASAILEPVERIFPPRWGLTEVMVLEKKMGRGKGREADHTDALLQ